MVTFIKMKERVLKSSTGKDTSTSKDNIMLSFYLLKSSIKWIFKCPVLKNKITLNMVANKCVVLQSQQSSFSKHVNTKERVIHRMII